MALEQQDQLEQQDLQVLRARLDQRVQLVRQAHLEMLVLQGHKVLLEQQAQLEQLGQQDLKEMQ